MDPSKEAYQSSIFAMRKDTSVLEREREKDHRKALSSEDPEMIAIRTLILTWMYINCGLNIVKNRPSSDVGTAQHY